MKIFKNPNRAFKVILPLAFIVLSSHTYKAPPSLDKIHQVRATIHDSKREHKDARKSRFVMDVYINGTTDAHRVSRFVVSPGKMTDYSTPGKEPALTPTGEFYPFRLEEDYASKQFSKKWLGMVELAKMPHSVFFHRGFAIHGSAQIVTGKPLSKGCVRLSKRNAQQFFFWVKAAQQNTGNLSSTKITIKDTDSSYVAEYRK